MFWSMLLFVWMVIGGLLIALSTTRGSWATDVMLVMLWPIHDLVHLLERK